MECTKCLWYGKCEDEMSNCEYFYCGENYNYLSKSEFYSEYIDYLAESGMVDWTVEEA